MEEWFGKTEPPGQYIHERRQLDYHRPGTAVHSRRRAMPSIHNHPIGDTPPPRDDAIHIKREEMIGAGAIQLVHLVRLYQT